MRAAMLILGSILFLALVGADDCNAQILRGRFLNPSAPKVVSAPPLLYQPPGHVGAYVPQDYNAGTVFPVADYFPKKQSTLSRIIDGPLTHRHRNPAEVDSRYVGGFHQTYFHNLGIPSGDIGIRGNAYKWRTW